MTEDDDMTRDRRDFLQAAGAVAATLSLGGLPSAARAAGEASGKMKIENVGVMSPGDMGQAVAIQIKAKGFNVYTALEHRSERTRGLAREAGLIDVGTVARLVAVCDVVLSIMDPGAALDFAREAADALLANLRGPRVHRLPAAIDPRNVETGEHILWRRGDWDTLPFGLPIDNDLKNIRSDQIWIGRR